MRVSFKPRLFLGIAACNIGGVTIHSFAGIGLGRESAEDLANKIRKNKKASARWLRTKVLIIDEGMSDGESRVLTLIQPFYHAQCQWWKATFSTNSPASEAYCGKMWSLSVAYRCKSCAYSPYLTYTLILPPRRSSSLGISSSYPL